MAQDSAFWNKGSGGDVDTAVLFDDPYDSGEYSDVLSKILASNQAAGYVIPGYNNNLVVTENSPAAMNVLVGTGALFVRGRIYENTAQVTVTIDAADPANPRIDRIVATITFASQEIRVAVVKGTAAGVPALPALTQTAATYQIDLAQVWVAAAAASITDEEIHDRRIFASNFHQETLVPQDNLLRNSEFIAFSELTAGIAGAAVDDPPECWELVATPSAFDDDTRAAQQPRGRSVKITADGANEGMSQTVPVKASTAYALRFLYKITAGDVGSVVVTTDSAAPGTITRNLRRTGSWLDEYVYYITEADAAHLTVSVLANNNTDIVWYGQALLLEGYNPGNFRAVHEVIAADKRAWLDTDFYGDTFAIGWAQIDLTSDFGTFNQYDVQAVSFQLNFNVAAAAADMVVSSIQVLTSAQYEFLMPVAGVAYDGTGIVGISQGKYFNIYTDTNNTVLTLRLAAIYT